MTVYDVIQQPVTRQQQVNTPAAVTSTDAANIAADGGYEIPIPTQVAPSSPHASVYETIE